MPPCFRELSEKRVIAFSIHLVSSFRLEDCRNDEQTNFYTVAKILRRDPKGKGAPMELPVYVTVEEVQRVCKLLGIRDWTQLTDTKVLPEEARVILAEINPQGMDIDLERFRMGLEVELEHGTQFKDANVTNNHPILTGKIVIAHFKEMLDYYERLEVAELEGDLLKALLAKNTAKIESYYRRLLKAKQALVESEMADLK
jgi:hypothetical protein